MHISHSQCHRGWIKPKQPNYRNVSVLIFVTGKNIPCPMEEDKPLLLALVSGDIGDDEGSTDVTLAWEDGLSIKAHQAILPAWSPQTNTPIPWSKLEVCSSNTKIVSTYFGHFREKKRGAIQAFLWQGGPIWQQASVVKHILQQKGDLEHQYCLP